MPVELPARPSCFRQFGAIQCTCTGKPERIACSAARSFWTTADRVACEPTDEARKRLLGILGKTPEARQKLRHAAWQLIQETAPKQVDLLP